MDTYLNIASSIISFFGAQYGAVGTGIGYAIAYGVPAISLLIELGEFIVSLLPTEEQAKWAKVEAVWGKIMPWLEALPHVNLPISPVALKVLSYGIRGISALKGFIQGWLKKDPSPPTQPPTP